MDSSSRFTPMRGFSSSTFLSSSTDESSSDEDQVAASKHRRRRHFQKMRHLVLSAQMLLHCSQHVERRNIPRDREGTHRQIMRDYFDENCTYPSELFRRQFRMRRELFLRILEDVEAQDAYFVQRKDCVGRWGCSSLQKMTAAIRILAYGFSSDHCDEYLKIGESTAIESLKRFCDAVIALYEGQYLRQPNEQDIARLLQEGEDRGFSGMLGSLDCMHWEWKNCPTAWHGTHRGHHNKPTLILEAVASKDLWIWHAFFGMPGSHNDVNVLDHSPIFDGLIHGRMPPINFEVNGHQYTLGYYLTDGIYPPWATLIQARPRSKTRMNTLTAENTNEMTKKESLFTSNHEAARKDVERAFGVLQGRWAITQGQIRFWRKKDICNIMKTCIILHNMIIEDERDTDFESWVPPPDESISTPEYGRDRLLLVAHISSRLNRINNRGTNAALRLDLKEHLWNKFGDQVV